MTKKTDMKHFLIFFTIFLFAAPLLFGQDLISNIQTNQQIDNVLRYDVQFTTSTAADAYIEYFHVENGDTVYQNTGASVQNTSHKITLVGLLSETAFQFRVRAQSSSLLENSPWMDFTTSAVPRQLA